MSSSQASMEEQESQVRSMEVIASGGSKQEVEEVRDMAGQHSIHREHSNWHLYPDFQKAVPRPLEEAHHYKFRPVSEALFMTRLDYYGDGNEESFKHKLLQSVIKDDFDVKIGSSDADGDLFGPCTMGLEGIVAKYSARLRQGYLPHAFTGPDFKGMNAKAIQKQLQEAGMTTPEPDGIWGFKPDMMP
ncbi:MAG: hypothetical protein Q9197_000749 [Variospora fuerteventurae]